MPHGEALTSSVVAIRGNGKLSDLDSRLAAIGLVLVDRAEAEGRPNLAARAKAGVDAVQSIAAIHEVRDVIYTHFKPHWPLVEAQLATVATLLLDSVTMSITLFAVGSSGSGKSTAMKMFRTPDDLLAGQSKLGIEPLIEEQDKFTIASFLSHYTERKSADLEAGALAFRLKHRVMLTGELGPTFRGDRGALETRFATLAQVLDGEGIRSSSGVHDTMGKKGDFTFVWLGATTPFRKATWETMAQLGTRLLFFEAAKKSEWPDSVFVPEEHYAGALNICQRAVAEFVITLFDRHGNNKRSLPWTDFDLDPIRGKVRQLGDLCALGQAEGGGNISEDPPIRPSSWHFRQRLMILACGRALLYGRRRCDESDLPMVRHIVRSSMRGSRGPVLLALYDGTNTVPDIAEATRINRESVSTTLDSLGRAGSVRKAGPLRLGKDGKPAERWELVWDE